MGNTPSAWKKYDSVELAKEYTGPKRDILIDQGLADNFYIDGQLKPEVLVDVKNDSLNIDFRGRDGYDHSYFYISTFIEEHFDFHLAAWQKNKE